MEMRDAGKKKKGRSCRIVPIPSGCASSHNISENLYLHDRSSYSIPSPGLRCVRLVETSHRLRLNSMAVSKPPPSAPSPRPSPSTTHPPTPSTPRLLLPGLPLPLDLGRVIHKQHVQWQRVGQDPVAHIVAPDGEGVEGDGLAVAHGQLDRLEVRVHLLIDAW